MKKLSLFIAMLPGASFAHGVHPEMAGASHDVFHGAVVGAVALIAVAMILAWQKERGR